MNRLAIQHLWSELGRLHERLRLSVEHRRTLNANLRLTAALSSSVSAQEVDDALAAVDARATASSRPSESAHEEAPDERVGAVLRAAAQAGVALPLERLGRALGLAAWERDCLVLCAGIELDPAYGRVFAYLRDQADGLRPSIAMLALVLSTDEIERAEIVRGLGPLGRLSRCGMLRACGGERRAGRELELDPFAFDLLVGGRDELIALFVDDDEVVLGEQEPAGSTVDAELLGRVAGALASGRSLVLGVWGDDAGERERVARHLAHRLGRRLFAIRRVSDFAIRGAIGRATAAGAVLWWDQESFAPASPDEAELRIAIERVQVPFIVTARDPWRPLWLLRSHRYVELRLTRSDLERRVRLWQAALPDARDDEHRRLALQYEMAPSEIEAVAAIASTTRALASNGVQAPLRPHVRSAADVVTRRATLRCASIVEPRRGPEDLILESRLHARVLEIPALHRASHEAARRWGIDHLVTGRGGLKFLFSGESGTGKTLAAEVVAGQLEAPMLRVDLAQIVSKWVGETEKNLEAVFEEASVTHAVLFFDEGDALFGKRSEVRHGTDRWANLEISFMLQRIEDHPGLVILATNLKENIDEAFVRRFQGVLYFPKPELAERRRLWEHALCSRVALGDDVSVDRLVQLEMTGASIVDVARTAAMLAVIGGRDCVAWCDLVEAIQRDFHRHGRCYPGRALSLGVGA